MPRELDGERGNRHGETCHEGTVGRSVFDVGADTVGGVGDEVMNERVSEGGEGVAGELVDVAEAFGVEGLGGEELTLGG